MKNLKQAHEKDLTRLIKALNEYDFSFELKYGIAQLRRSVMSYTAGFLQYSEVPFSVAYNAVMEWCEQYFDKHVEVKR